MNTLEIRDINHIKVNTGMIVNEHSTLFKSILINQKEYIKNRLLDSVKGNPYLPFFEEKIIGLSDYYFFVKINEKMYVCGAEKCSIEKIGEKDDNIACALMASFHLYSTECGFYQVNKVITDCCWILPNKTQKEYDIFDGTCHMKNTSFSEGFYVEKDNTFQPIEWKTVYQQQNLTTVLVENHSIKSFHKKQYDKERAINNILHISSPYFYGNPQLLLFPSEIINVSKELLFKIRSNELYFYDNIDMISQNKFEFIFKSNFDKTSNIAIIYASRAKTFKRLSVDSYYVSYDKTCMEEIVTMYFLLSEMNCKFNEDIIDYVNKTSVLKSIKNLLQAWTFIRYSIPLEIGGLSEKNYTAFEKAYKSIYHSVAANQKNNIYNNAIAKGFKLNKWSSEQSLYALIVKFYNDAVYQYQDKWLGLQSLDAYIPSLKIAFEYQGEQHYTATDFFGGEEKFKIRQERDERKRKLCLENGVTLIEWRYDEKITKENLATKLQPFINELPEENLDYSWEDEKLKLALAKEAKEKEKKSSKPKVPTKVLVQYDIDGNYINHFTSQEEASKKTNASKFTISLAINGKQKTSGGYVWRYFDADKIPEKIEKTEITSPEAKEVIQLDLDGNILKTFPSITSASKICGICTKNIRNVINGKQKTAGGYKWKLKE